MRPKGKKSTYTKRNSLHYRDIKKLLDDYGTLSNKEILNKYKISMSQLRNIRREYKVKSKQVAHLLNQKIDDIKNKDVVCGIYAICKEDFKKIYIGSSVDIYERLRNHYCLLISDAHYNKEMQTDFKDNLFYYFLVLECQENELLEKENEIITQINNGILYNKNIYTPNIDVQEIFNTIKDKVKPNENGCWVWQGKINKSGYGGFKFKNKDFLAHRIFYIYHNQEYPYIVHHKCHNKLCCNPEHLESVSASKNAKQKHPDLFLKKSKLFVYKDAIVDLRKNGYGYVKIKNKLNIDAEPTTIYNFCKKLKTLGLL